MIEQFLAPEGRSPYGSAPFHRMAFVIELMKRSTKGSLEELRLDYEDYLRQRDLPLSTGDHPALVRFKARQCNSLSDFRLWVADEVKREKEKETRTNDKETRTDTDQHGPSESANGRASNPDVRDGGTPTDTDQHGPPESAKPRANNSGVRESPCSSVSPYLLPSVFVANGALALINLCVYLLDRQMKAQADAFERDGGFTERLYRKRTEARRRNKD